ncbi:transcriptional regulator, AraC family [candidate division TM7 genomosp. GTL1]|nr:transcriptional regulator, AraC family [candidate division TM7 genomosp. GTL1]
MNLQRDICYKALLAQDPRFDGLFFTCVTSTGIYCRSICRAIVPREENCIFVASPMEAEKAGYRPCLRCRPEYAPLSKSNERTAASRLADYIDETLLADESLTQAAGRLRISDRHLRRMFEEQFGVEPKKYLTTRRLLFAKQLLQDTTMSVTQVAYMAGFGSQSRLTINMRRSYGFTPDRLRKDTSVHARSQTLMLRTDYRPPFDWDLLLGFIKKRATPSEWATDTTYHRLIGSDEIVVRNVPAKNYLTIEVPQKLSRHAHAILMKVRRLFDLDANPSVITTVLTNDPYLKPFLADNPGVRVPGCWDNFEMLIRAVVGQQVSVSAATTVMRRLVERIGSTPDTLAASSADEIASIGMPLKRATTIHTLAHKVKNSDIDLNECDPQRFADQFQHISGIGPWTIAYLQLRILHWPDALPAEDIGLQRALIPYKRITKAELSKYAEAWRPWRSYAVFLLWNASSNQGG